MSDRLLKQLTAGDVEHRSEMGVESTVPAHQVCAYRPDAVSDSVPRRSRWSECAGHGGRASLLRRCRDTSSTGARGRAPSLRAARLRYAWCAAAQLGDLTLTSRAPRSAAPRPRGVRRGGGAASARRRVWRVGVARGGAAGRVALALPRLRRGTQAAARHAQALPRGACAPPRRAHCM